MWNLITRMIRSTFRRFPVASLLNVLGLAIAFAAFVVIMMRVSYERQFDRCHTKADRIYRVDLVTGDHPEGFPILACPFVKAVIQSSPSIEEGTLLNPFIGSVYVSVEQKGERVGFEEPMFTCLPSTTRIFDFQMLAGDAGCLEDEGMALIPESMARRFFGDEPAVGKMIHLEEKVWTKEGRQFLTVGGVYRDFPQNTQLNNAIYSAFPAALYGKENWGQNYLCYVLLAEGADPESVSENFSRTFDFSAMSWVDSTAHIHLLPLTDIYYQSAEGSFGVIKSGNQEGTYMYVLVAFVVLLIALVNFMNYYLSLVPIRIRVINTCKVLGSSELSLRISLVAESILLTLVAYVVGIVLVVMLADSGILASFGFDLHLAGHIGLLSGLAFVALLLGLLFGLYPAWFATSFPPALVLKGSFGLSPQGKKLRWALMGFQFVMSFVLIVSSMFMKLQDEYMRKFSLGFDKDQILVVELNNKIAGKHQDTYRAKLRTSPAIEDVAFSMQKLGGGDAYMYWGYDNQGVNMELNVLPVSWNFFDVMGIQLLSGEKPTPADGQGNSVVIYPYESLDRALNYKSENLLDGYWEKGDDVKIGGIVPDIQFYSLRKKMQNAFFVVGYDALTPVSYIRVKAGSDIDAVFSHIRQILSEIDPTFPAEIEFYDTVLAELYHQETMLAQTVYFFSFLAIVLSLMGIFCLVMFEMMYRQKEIGLRKVMGATVREVLSMLGRKYFRMVTGCFVLALPLSYYAVYSWLQHFAFKTPVYWSVFLLAFVLILLITLATVLLQSWRVAVANPVESIRTE